MRPLSRNMTGRGIARIEVLVFVGVIALLGGLLIPAVQQARESARKAQSKNNLKQLGLALHNYHDVFRCLPPGATVMADGRACHGWFSQICPYVDASPLFSQIDFNRPWNDRVNQHLFRFQYPIALIPGVKWAATSEGYGLSHYSANPSVLHRNSSITFDRFTAGTRHGWLLGEAVGNHEPWASPFNWREWDKPLNSGDDSFGRWEDGAHFLIADGSVRFVSEQESESVRPSLSGGLPVQFPVDVERPTRRWKYVTSSNANTRAFIDLDDLNWDGLVLKVCYDQDGSTHTATIQPRGKWSDRVPNINDLQRVVETCPDAKVVLVDIPIDERASELLVQFSRLEVVRVSTVSTEPAVIANFQQLKQLEELIIGNLSANSAQILIDELPSVVIDVRSLPKSATPESL